LVSGDVISDVDVVAAAGGSVDFTPAAGVQVVITSLHSDRRIPAVSFNIVIGGNRANSCSGADLGQVVVDNFKIFLNDTTTLRRLNGDGAADNMGYTGMEL